MKLTTVKLFFHIFLNFTPVSVDLRVSRIYRHLVASPLFGGQVAGAGGTPPSASCPPKDRDAARWQ